MDAMLQALGATLHKFTDALNELIPSFKQTTESMEVSAAAQVELAQEFKKVRKGDAAKKLKLEAPSKYEGEPNKAEGFIAELEMYFDTMDVDDKDQQIVYTLSKVRGGNSDTATYWVNSICTLMQANKLHTPLTVIFPDWGSFTQTLRNHFVLRGVTETSVENMHNLEMGTTTCEEYSILFKGYASQSGYNEVALIEEYK